MESSVLTSMAPSPAEELRPTTAKTFGPRAASYLIDAGVLYGIVQLMGLLGLGLISPVLALLGYELHFVKTVEYPYALRLLDGAVSSFTYFVLLEWLFGASIGKLILGIRVVELNGQPCSLLPALVRGAVRFIDGFFFGIPAATSMSSDPELQQRLGDKAARTVVVDRRDPFIRRTRAPWRLPAALAAFLALMQVWAVLFVLLAGQNSLGPRFRPVNVLAAAANLQGADFSPALDLSEENGPADFTNFHGKDISKRLFVAEDAVVQSTVALFDSRLTDTLDDMIASSEEALRSEFQGEQLTLEAPQRVTVGDRATMRKFANAAAASEGYVVVFRRSNAYVRLIFYGPPGRFTPDQASSMAAIIEARLTSAGAQGQ